MDTQNAPVNLIASDTDREPDIGVGLCLSGGGYRAMLFHLGALLRLVELGYLGSKSRPPEFGKMERISSVSGGSITSAALGEKWAILKLNEAGARGRFFEHVITPIRNLGRASIDVRSVLIGLLPFTSVAHQIAKEYCEPACEFDPVSAPVPRTSH